MMVKKYSTKSLSEIAGGDTDIMRSTAKTSLEERAREIKTKQGQEDNDIRK